MICWDNKEGDVVYKSDGIVTEILSGEYDDYGVL